MQSGSGSFSVTLHVPRLVIEYLLMRSFSGPGADYWIESITIEKSADCAHFSSIPIHGGSLLVKSYYDERSFSLNGESISTGLKKMAKESDYIVNVVAGSVDDITADVFLQYCLFGKVKIE